MAVLPQLESYDWPEVFKYANGSSECEFGGRPEPAIPADDIDCSTFDREDVEEIVAIIDGENDESDWLLCGRLKDGRWFALRAGCDYTGWG